MHELDMLNDIDVQLTQLKNKLKYVNYVKPKHRPRFNTCIKESKNYLQVIRKILANEDHWLKEYRSKQNEP